MALDLAALKTELTNDPLGLGYSGDTDPSNLTTAHADADLMNSLATGRTLPRDTVGSASVLAAVPIAELKALTATDREIFRLYIQTGEIPVNDANVLAAFLDLFGPGTTARTNLAALRNRAASRAEELFGEGVEVFYYDVGQARELP